MSGACSPFAPQPSHSHESKGSSFPLAFTFHVPKKHPDISILSKFLCPGFNLLINPHF